MEERKEAKKEGKNEDRMKENKNHFCKMTKSIEYDVDKLLNMFHISHLCV